MAILDPQTPSASSDVVAIMDADTDLQLFEGARPIKATVSEQSQLMAHPRENGSVQIDHKIDLPISIQIAVIMDPESYAATYNDIREAKVSGRRLTVQTKTFTHTNMFIESIPREEDPKYFDTITMVITLVQAFIFGTEPTNFGFAGTDVITPLAPAAVISSNDSSTVNRGQILTTPASPERVGFVVQALDFLRDPVTSVLDLALNATPNQEFSFLANGQRVAMKLNSLGGGVMSSDITVNGVNILSASRIVPAMPLIPYEHLSTASQLGGTLFLITENNEYADANQFGLNQFLVFASVL